ncbi:MAG: ABC transporter ATP-binding protein, partial [Fusobacterium sp.]|nr:ABC transporter ATP-binding protein [Fusobacterium sp.]
SVLPSTKENLRHIFLGDFSTQFYFYMLMVCGFFRGVLHYLEQYCNHHIAFHVLAEIRVKLFSKIRELAPTKMEGENQGDFVSMLTADIELLEVFYAHTVSPIIIAFLTSVVLFIYYFKLNVAYAFYGLIGQIFIGIIVPYFASKKASKDGMETRNKFGKLNNEFLDNLRGLREVIQFGQGNRMAKKIEDITLSLGENQKDLRKKMAEVQMWTDATIMIVSVGQLFLSMYLISKNLVSIEVSILAGMLLIGSFAPYINLANLGNILSQTFACGERVLSLLEEEAPIIDKKESSNLDLKEDLGIEIKNLSFGYEENKDILKDINLNIGKGKLIGIQGESGCGKSTLLKLIMRFWDTKTGEINLMGENTKNYSLSELREKFNYMTQSTSLFIGNIRDNLLVAKPDATDEEIYESLKKASLYDYVMSLPEKLDSVVEEGGKNFSGGERQRIGLARSFLANRDLFLLDEPTSNLDILNEAIILKSLVQEIKNSEKNKTVILVSHRESTLSICDKIFKMENGVIIN